MKKLLVVGDFISGSGLTQVIFNVFSRFPSKQFQIDAIGYGQDPTQYTDEKCAELGWPLHRVIPVTKNPIKHWRWWKQYFKQHHYDIAYFNYSSSWNYLPLIYAKRYGQVKKIVCHSHNTYFSHTFSNSIMMKLLTLLNDHGKNIFNKYSDVKVATSKAAAIWMFGKQSISNTYVSINGIDLNKFSFSVSDRINLREKYHLNSQTKLIGFVGVLQSRKNPLFALNVFREYHKINLNSKFVMLGKGPLKKIINNKINTWNLNDDVIQIDFTPNVNNWYSAMDALLFPSMYEGLPLVTIEAQISNLPILASDTNTSVIFVTHNIKKMHGLNVDIWNHKLLKVLARDHLINRNYLDKALNPFSVECQASAIQQLLKK